jgi:hypothetical protein
MLRTKVGAVCDVVAIRLSLGEGWALLRVRRDDGGRKVEWVELDVDDVSEVRLNKRLLQSIPVKTAPSSERHCHDVHLDFLCLEGGNCGETKQTGLHGWRWGESVTY